MRTYLNNILTCDIEICFCFRSWTANTICRLTFVPPRVVLDDAIQTQRPVRQHVTSDLHQSGQQLDVDTVPIPPISDVVRVTVGLTTKTNPAALNSSRVAWRRHYVHVA